MVPFAVLETWTASALFGLKNTNSFVTWPRKQAFSAQRSHSACVDVDSKSWMRMQPPGRVRNLSASFLRSTFGTHFPHGHFESPQVAPKRQQPCPEILQIVSFPQSCWILRQTKMQSTGGRICHLSFVEKLVKPTSGQEPRANKHPWRSNSGAPDCVPNGYLSNPILLVTTSCPLSDRTICIRAPSK